MGDFEEEDGEEEEEEEMDTSGGEVTETVLRWRLNYLVKGEAEAPAENLQEPADALRVVG